MQVFTPMASPFKNAKSLDPKRKNKQILEIIQIICANTGINVGWKIPKSVYNHPNTLKWKGYESYLLKYLYYLFLNYKKNASKKAKKQYKSNCFYHKSGYAWYILASRIPGSNNILPPWFTKENCYEHQELLISKKPEFYKLIFNL